MTGTFLIRLFVVQAAAVDSQTNSLESEATVGAKDGKSAEAGESGVMPDLNDAQTLAKILGGGSISADLLEARGPEGAKLGYAPNAQTPYTGWTKKFYPSGKLRALAHMREGLTDGPYILWHENGKKQDEGTMKKGKVEGFQTLWDENGQKFQEGTIKDGLREGPYTIWYQNGKKMEEGSYRKGKLQGTQTLWYESGQKKQEVSFKDEQQHGPTILWYINGQKKQESTYQNGKLNGKLTEWYENGHKSKECTFKDEQPIGLYVRWYENGKKQEEGTYANGKFTGSQTLWYENGQKKLEANFKDGQPNDSFTTWDENGNQLERSHIKNGKKVFEGELDIAKKKDLGKILEIAVKWETLERSDFDGLYYPSGDPKPYTGWFQKLHDNGKVALLGCMKDGQPAGLWTWLDETGVKQEEKRYSAPLPSGQ